MRRLYCTKDTFVTTALQANVKVAWLETQTGVAWATLRKHYGKWITPEHESELSRFAGLAPAALLDPLSRGRGSKPRQVA